jgi:histone H3/H4
MAHAQELQKSVDTQLVSVNTAIKRLERESGEAILSLIRREADKVVSTASNAIQGLLEELKEVTEEAKETALKAKVSIHNSWVQWVGLLVMAGVVTAAATIAAVFLMTVDLRREASWLRSEIEKLEAQTGAEREMLNKIRSETWGIRLLEREGERFILLKAGDRAQSREKDDTAIEKYTIGEGRNKQEAIKVLP